MNTSCIRDQDGDGYGDIADGGIDCDDTDVERTAKTPMEMGLMAVPIVMTIPFDQPQCIEICLDNLDNNCDELIDDPSAINAALYFLDDDDDGYGDPEISAYSCGTLEGYVLDDTDCDDTDESWNQDDLDGDTYSTCTGDCNDTNMLQSPDVVEVLNNLDDDCNGQIDNNTSSFDDDGDGYCENPPCIGSLTELASNHNEKEDCNDSSIDVSPIQLGFPNGIDDDCNGYIDDITLIFDDDGDGYCENPPCIGSMGTLHNDSNTKPDCNDEVPSILLARQKLQTI